MARAEFDARISLSAMVLAENQDVPAGTVADASNLVLAYGDLRAVLYGRRLAGGVELKGDLRLRLSSDFSQADAVLGHAQVSARGYAPSSFGAREYHVRELWVGRHGDSVDFGVGRLIVREADATTIDGARLWWRFSPHWHASLFGGFYPNPFARSLPDDYVSSSALAGAVGADTAYLYPRVWGSVSLVAAILGGGDDGGALPSMGVTLPPPAGPTVEAPRVFFTWTNYLRIASWLDVYHDLVVDVAGAAGAQLTRADALLQARLGRLTVAAGYGHLSSLAVEMYLLRLLNDRRTFLPGTIENNLVVERTARDEGRLRADVRAAGHLHLYGEGVLRHRALLEPGEDPNFAAANPLGAWDVTVGARSAGDLAGLRLGAAFTEIADFRAETQLLVLDAGRDLWREQLSLDLALAWERIRDLGAGMSCSSPVSSLDAGCYGRRSGQVVQAGLTLAIRPSPSWFLLLDYRLVVDSADGASAIVTQVGFARVELRL